MHLARINRAVFVFLLLVVCRSAAGQEFNRTPWLEDFIQLKKELASHYANLDWAVEARGLDLKKLSGRTDTLLQQARNETEAKRIIESFLNAFGDGHLTINWAQPKAPAAAPPDTAKAPVDLCTRLEFEVFTSAPRVPFTLLKNYTEVKNDDSKYFSIGVLRIGNRNIGIIRIPIFSEYRYPGLCEMAAKEMQLDNTSACDEDCQERLSLRAADLLTAALARQVEVLKNSKIDLLVVDITGNGGGTNWTEAAARTFTPKPLQSPRQQFIKHQHWTSQLKRRLEIIEADLRTAQPAHAKQLNEAAEKLRIAIAQSGQPCDRSVVWENQKPACNLVADSPTLYPQSVRSYAPPGSLPDLPSSPLLFYPGRYSYREGVYKGQLMVLVDAGTWSSAEYFAAMLKDNKAATIVGLPTGGAGCGYTNGGIPTFLKNSGARVKIPDCVRLRADGSNEVEGITPDLLIPWRFTDNAYQRANRFLEVMTNYLRK